MSCAIRANTVTRAITPRPALLLAFAFAVMADPVSSAAYAIEAERGAA